MMQADTPNRITDINQKYVGTRVNVRKTQTYLPGSQISPAGISVPASSITRRGPVTTVGALAPLIQPDGAPGPWTPQQSPPRNTGRLDTETPGFDGSINTQTPAHFWDDQNQPPKKSVTQKMKGCCGCPWWALLILTLLLLSALFGGLYTLLKKTGNSINKPQVNVDSNRPNQINYNDQQQSDYQQNQQNQGENQGQNAPIRDQRQPNPANAGDSVNVQINRNPEGGSVTINNNTNTKETTTDRKQILNCNPGYFLHNGKCLSCPGQSKWNGTNCIKTQLVNTTITTITNSSGTFVLSSDHKVVPLRNL